MSVIGFSFNKIHVEKKKPAVGEINIINNVKLTGITEEKIRVGEDHLALNVGFEYKINYAPDVGSLHFTGNVIYLGDKETQKLVLKAWEEKKNLDNRFSLAVTNAVLSKCNIKAIGLCAELGLPTHIALPIAKPTGNKTNEPVETADAGNYIG